MCAWETRDDSNVLRRRYRTHYTYARTDVSSSSSSDGGGVYNEHQLSVTASLLALHNARSSPAVQFIRTCTAAAPRRPIKRGNYCGQQTSSPTLPPPWRMISDVRRIVRDSAYDDEWYL